MFLAIGRGNMTRVAGRIDGWNHYGT